MQCIETLLNMAASAATTIGIIIALIQMYQNRKIRQADFEDGINQEYRKIIKSLPYRVFTNEALQEEEYQDLLEEFFQYFDLSNNEIVLRKNNRIGNTTWKEWSEGIKDNLNNQTFKKAYEEIIKGKIEVFSELQKLVNEEYKSDPKSWK